MSSWQGTDLLPPCQGLLARKILQRICLSFSYWLVDCTSLQRGLESTLSLHHRPSVLPQTQEVSDKLPVHLKRQSRPPFSPSVKCPKAYTSILHNLYKLLTFTDKLYQDAGPGPHFRGILLQKLMIFMLTLLHMARLNFRKKVNEMVYVLQLALV